MGENHMSPNVHPSVWTISTNDIQNEHENLPSYNRFITSQINTIPPNYYDISIIPRGAILHYNDVVPFYEASKAKITRKTNGVYSNDLIFDKNPDQLWLYLMTYLKEKPCLLIKIHGMHESIKSSELHYSMNASRYLNRNHELTRWITDFNYSIDLTAYVSKNYFRMRISPLNNSNKNITFRDVLEQYTHSDDFFKEICCQKHLIGWNFDILRLQIKDLIHSTGYNGIIDIDFPVNNQQIFARKSSLIERFSHSIWIHILCLLSCLWLIFLPIYCYLRCTRYVRHQIIADYQMITSQDVFLRLNKTCITKAVLMHSKQHYLARIT